MKLSIIVPVYNVERYIEACINSIISQKFKDFELILIDDCSTDRSASICEKFKKKDNRIKFINNKCNIGTASSRNKGIEIARGEYIGFVDSDDTIEYLMYYKMIKIAEKDSSEIVAVEISNTNNKIVMNNFKNLLEKNEIKKTFEDTLSASKTVMAYPSVCNKIYNKKFIDSLNLKFDKNLVYAEDLCFNIKAILRASRMSIIKEILYNYRLDNLNSVTKKDNEKRIRLEIKSMKKTLEILESEIIDRSVYSEYLKYQNYAIITRYMELVKKIQNQKCSNINKIKKINNILNEEYLLESSSNYSNEHKTLKITLFNFIVKIKKYMH